MRYAAALHAAIIQGGTGSARTTRWLDDRNFLLIIQGGTGSARTTLADGNAQQFQIIQGGTGSARTTLWSVVRRRVGDYTGGNR